MLSKDMGDVAVALPPASHHRSNPLGDGGSPGSSKASVSLVAANEGGPAAADNATSAVGGDRNVTVEAQAAIEYGEGYRAILEAMGEPGYGAMKALFYGEEGPPPSTIPSVSVSFELFESVQSRFVATEKVLERTRADLHARCQEFNEMSARCDQLQASYDVLEKRSVELERNNTQLHQSIARHNVAADQLRQQIGRLKSELGMFEERMAKRDEELQISNNRVAEGLVALSLKETIIANLRRQIGMTSYGKRASHHQLLQDGGEYSAEALKIIADGVEGSSVEAEHRLYALGLEAEIRKLEDEKKYIMLRHTLYRKHVQEVTEAYEVLCMEKEDAVLSHTCASSSGEPVSGEGEETPASLEPPALLAVGQHQQPEEQVTPRSFDRSTVQGGSTSKEVAQLAYGKQSPKGGNPSSPAQSPPSPSASAFSDRGEDAPSPKGFIPKSRAKTTGYDGPVSGVSGRDSRASVSWDKLASPVAESSPTTAAKGRQSSVPQPLKGRGESFSPLGLPRPETTGMSSPRATGPARQAEKSKKKGSTKRPGKEPAVSRAGTSGQSSDRVGSEQSPPLAESPNTLGTGASSDVLRRGTQSESRSERPPRREEAQQRPHSPGAGYQAEGGRKRMTSEPKVALSVSDDAERRERKKMSFERKGVVNAHSARSEGATPKEQHSQTPLAMPPLAMGRGPIMAGVNLSTSDDGEQETHTDTGSLSQTAELTVQGSPLTTSIRNHVTRLASKFDTLHGAILELNELMESLSLKSSVEAPKAPKFTDTVTTTNVIALIEHMVDVIASDAVVLEDFLRHVRERLSAGGSLSDSQAEGNGSLSSVFGAGSPKSGGVSKAVARSSGALQGLHVPSRGDSSSSQSRKTHQTSRRPRTGAGVVASAASSTGAAGRNIDSAAGVGGADGSSGSAASPLNQRRSPILGTSYQQLAGTAEERHDAADDGARPTGKHGARKGKDGELPGRRSPEGPRQQRGKPDTAAPIRQHSPGDRRTSSQLSRSDAKRSSLKSAQSHYSGSSADHRQQLLKGGAAPPPSLSPKHTSGGSGVSLHPAAERGTTPAGANVQQSSAPTHRGMAEHIPGSSSGASHPLTETVTDQRPGTTNAKGLGSTGGSSRFTPLPMISRYAEGRASLPVTVPRRGVPRIPWRASVIRVDLLSDVPELKQKDRVPPATFTGLQQNFSFLQQRGTTWYHPEGSSSDDERNSYEPGGRQPRDFPIFTPRTVEQIFSAITGSKRKNDDDDDVPPRAGGGVAHSGVVGPSASGEAIPNPFLAQRGVYRPHQLRQRLARGLEVPSQNVGIYRGSGGKTDGSATERTYMTRAEEAHFRSLSKMLLAQRPRSAVGPVLPQGPVLQPSTFRCFDPFSTAMSIHSMPAVRPRPYVNMSSEGGYLGDGAPQKSSGHRRPAGRGPRVRSGQQFIGATLGDAGDDTNFWQGPGVGTLDQTLSSRARSVQRKLLRSVNRLCQGVIGRRSSNLAFCQGVVRRFVRRNQGCGTPFGNNTRLSGFLIKQQILRYSALRARALRNCTRRLPRRAFFVKQCILSRKGSEHCSHWVLVPLELRYLGGRHPPEVRCCSAFRMSR